MIKPENTRTLGRAICDHLKLDAGRVASDYTLTHSQGAARVNLTVFLTAEDMASIMRKAAGQSMNPRYPSPLAFVGDLGPELINFAAPSKLYDSALQELRSLAKKQPAKPDAPAPDSKTDDLSAEIKVVRDQLAFLRKDMDAAAERLTKLQIEQAKRKG